MCCHNRPFAQRVPDGRSGSGIHSPITSICRSVPSNCSACARASSGLSRSCAFLMNATTYSYVMTVLRGGVSLNRISERIPFSLSQFGRPVTWPYPPKSRSMVKQPCARARRGGSLGDLGSRNLRYQRRKSSPLSLSIRRAPTETFSSFRC